MYMLSEGTYVELKFDTGRCPFMGCEATFSDQGGLFSLDLSQHGGTAVCMALSASVKAAELQGQRLEAFAFPTSPLELTVSLHAIHIFGVSIISSHLRSYHRGS